MLTEKVGSSYTKRYVWSPVYVDALVLRDRDTDANGTLDERLWVQQDANWNVTALVNGGGNVVERYAYDAFGVVTVLDGSFGSRGTSSYGWDVLWQGMRLDGVSGSYKSRGRTDISPTLGRPFQLDPLGIDAGDVNFYRWEENSPTNAVDPTGLQPPLTTPQSTILPSDQLANPLNYNYLWAPGKPAANPGAAFNSNLGKLGYLSGIGEPALSAYVGTYNYVDGKIQMIASADAIQLQGTFVSPYFVGGTIAPTIDKYGNVYIYTGAAAGKPGFGLSVNGIYYHTPTPMTESQLQDNVSGWCYDVGGVAPVKPGIGTGVMVGQSYSTGTVYHGVIIGTPGRVTTGGYTWTWPKPTRRDDIYIEP